MGSSWLSVPRDWIASFGDIAKFCARVAGSVFNGRVFRFFGEALRQAGILILGSALVIWGMVFILGLQCGIEGAYFGRSVGVGQATAKSMILNMVLVHLIGMMGSQVFWGANPRAPIGG